MIQEMTPLLSGQTVQQSDYVVLRLTYHMQGGPGCSGLLGFFAEQGPYRPNADLKLDFNEFAWNKVANMVFIESPVGVGTNAKLVKCTHTSISNTSVSTSGYSYSDEPEDYVWGDAETATLNYEIILGFLDRFPEYAQNDLYISSESYGGHCKEGCMLMCRYLFACRGCFCT